MRKEYKWKGVEYTNPSFSLSEKCLLHRQYNTQDAAIALLPSTTHLATILAMGGATHNVHGQHSTVTKLTIVT